MGREESDQGSYQLDYHACHKVSINVFVTSTEYKLRLFEENIKISISTSYQQTMIQLR